MDAFLPGLLLGLSAGVACLGYCAPALVPYLMAERRTAFEPALVIAQVSAGRLLAYLAVGALAGYLGSRLEGEPFQAASALAMLAMGVLLGLFILKPAAGRVDFLCRLGRSLGPRYPLLFGVLAGLNLCPPFLAAIAFGASTGDAMRGALGFAGFFLGTTLYLIPLVPLGWASRWDNIQVIGRMAGALSALLLIVLGAGQLVLRG